MLPGCHGESNSQSAPGNDDSEEEALATAREAIVEPTCVTVERGVFGSAQDTLLSGDYPNWAAGGETGLWTGLSGGGSQNRILVSFDLGFLSPYSNVVSATFRIKVAWNEQHSLVRLHRVTQPWAEATATLQNFGVYGYDPAVAGSFDPEGYTYESADVTSVVNEWVREIHPNYGFLLEEDPVKTHYYYSSESGGATNRPMLEVCYRNGPKPHRGGALVAGGVTSDSEGHHFVGTLSEGPGRNQVASSENHRFIGGVVGATQQ
ncbi:MAG: DNRLRE domain-containing protein [Polyangiaceae bacterium]